MGVHEFPKHPVSRIEPRLEFVSYMIVYMFQCHSPKSSHHLPLPQSPKVHSIHLFVYHLTNDHYTFCENWKWKSLSHARLFVAPWTPLSMEFSRQEYWGGLPFPSPGDLPDPGTEPRSPALQADSLPSEPPGYTEIHSYSYKVKL